MVLFGKKKNNFEDFRDKINKLLDKGNFDSALSKFSDLSDAYNRLKLTKKIECEEDYSLIRDQFILYMKIKEMDFYVNSNEIEKLKDALNFSETKAIKLRVGHPKLLAYFSEKHNNYLRIFNAMVYKQEFDENLYTLYGYIEREEFDKALKLFPVLFKAFEDIGNSIFLEKGLDEKLIMLKKEIEMEFLEKRAYSDVAKVDVKRLRRSLMKKK